MNWRVILCWIFGHDWLAYDLGTDKCLRCDRERRDGATFLGMTRCELCGMVACNCPGRSAGVKDE